MEPINYLGMMPQYDLSGSLLKGLQAGAVLSELKQNQHIREKQQQAEADYMASMEKYRQTNDPNVLYDVMIRHPEYGKGLSPILDKLTAKQKQADAMAVGQTLTSLRNNDVETAKGVINKYIDAYTAEGKDTTQLKQIQQAIEINPTSVIQTLEPIYAGMVDTEQFKKYAEANKFTQETQQAREMQPYKVAQEKATAEKVGSEAIIKGEEAKVAPEMQTAKLSKEQAEAKKATVESLFAKQVEEGKISLNKAQISNIASQIKDRSIRTGIAQQELGLKVAEHLQKLAPNMKNLPADTRKLVNESAINSSTSSTAATQLNSLASKLDNVKWTSGYAGTAREWFKQATGTEDSISQLKKQYVALKNQSVIKNLPAGPASDRDISIFMAGFPSENANPKQLTAFTRGMAKVETINSKIEEAKADWMVNNGALGRTGNDFVAGGYKAKAGQTFPQFAASVAQAEGKKFNKTAEAQQLQNQGYSVGANPPAPKAPTKQTKALFNAADAIILGQ